MAADSQPSIPLATIELLRRARGGERDAIASLYTRYVPRVRGLTAVRMGRSLIDLVDHDDIVQESMLDALAKLDTFEPRSENSFICWLSRFVEARIKSAWRAARTEKRGGGNVLRRADLGTTTLSKHAAVSDQPSPSEVYRAHEFDEALETALLAIGDPHRQIVYCRLVLEMSHAEIATELGMANANSARAMFHKAVTRLRGHLDPPA